MHDIHQILNHFSLNMAQNSIQSQRNRQRMLMALAAFTWHVSTQAVGSAAPAAGAEAPPLTPPAPAPEMQPALSAVPDIPLVNGHAPLKEKCYGIALKGRNDCRTSIHKCAGLAVRDYDPEDWNYLPLGACQKIIDDHAQKLADKALAHE